MSKETKATNENLHELEKLVKKILRKSLKDNTLDYTCQFTISSMEPGKVKYATQISSPANGVQPITYIFDNFNDLRNALIASEKEIDKKAIELVFHQSRINTYENKIQAHKARIVQIEAGEIEEEDDGIEMEELGATTLAKPETNPMIAELHKHEN